MRNFVIFFISFIVVTYASPLSLNTYTADPVHRLSDRGMHPHLQGNSEASHKKVKRSPKTQINEAEFKNSYWINKAKDSIEEKLKNEYSRKKAKNVIFFLGDGMSHMSVALCITYISHTAAARVLQNGESSKLSFESFPFTASSITYCVDNKVPDSACSGTAFLHGVKTNNGIIGLNAQAKRGNCNDTNNNELYTSSIAAWFLKEGRNAGIVTTTNIADATPASVFANIAERNWAGNEDITKSGCNHSDVYDIAEQLIRGPVGSKLKVVLGGGSKNFITTADSEHGSYGSRTDGKNLIKEWLNDKPKRNYVKNRKELMDLDFDDVDQLLGFFNSGHLPFHLETVTKNEQSIYPTLTEMTEKAIDLLSGDDDGYFLLVEGGRIDHGHHGNQAKFALDEVLEFSKAIQAAVDKVDLDETLIVVTADHGHVMTLAGYQYRGTDIFAATSKGGDGMPYFSLSYANGPGFSIHNKNGKRVNPESLNTSPADFKFPSGVNKVQETHGGEDVGIWAIGANAHIFKGSIEQNVIAHLMAYASCVGDGLKACN